MCTACREYYELGKLQPDLNAPHLVAKRENAQRVKEFSENLALINKATESSRCVAIELVDSIIAASTFAASEWTIASDYGWLIDLRQKVPLVQSDTVKDSHD